MEHSLGAIRDHRRADDVDDEDQMQDGLTVRKVVLIARSGCIA
jgi:hypothetical protein